jgi:hypothetical protein
MAHGRSSKVLVLLALLTLGGCREPDVAWEQAPPQSPEAPGVEPWATRADSRIAPDNTATLIVLLVLAPWGLIAGWSLYWWLEHQKRALAERTFDPRSPLTNGYAVIVGQVELEQGATGAAIQVVIRQRGRDWKGKHGWHHSWTETSREVRVRPFWVRTFTGERVRVEPDDRVLLRDDLSRIDRLSRFERVRYAELTPGETVHIAGSLFGAGARTPGDAYRAMTQEPVLRPSRGAPMTVSTERPGETAQVRARLYRNWFAGAALVALTLPAVVFPTVALLALTGETVRAEPVATRHWQRYHKPKNSPGYYVQHYGLRSVQAKRGSTRVLTDECSERVWSCVNSGACPSVQYTVSALSDDVVQIGVGPQLTDGRAGLLGVLASFLVGLFPLSIFGSRPWYLRRKVVDGGKGQLPDFIAPPSGGFGPR